MFRIGAVNIDTSHAPAFAELFLKGETAKYTAVYNDAFRSDEYVRNFMDKYGLEKRYDSLAEMAENVDMAFIQGCDWDRHIECIEPFVKAGKPVFVDKPLVGNYADVLKIEQMVANGAVILGTSALRYTYEHDSFFAIDPVERGEVLHVTANVGVDEFNYAIHAVESIMGFMGGGASAESVRLVNSGESAGTPYDSYIIKFNSGASATYNICLKGWQPSTALVLTTKTGFAYKIDTSKVYEAMLKRVSAYIEGKPHGLATPHDMLESVKIMLAGKKSKEENGREVALRELSVADKGFDGAQFEKEYAAMQK